VKRDHEQSRTATSDDALDEKSREVDPGRTSASSSLMTPTAPKASGITSSARQNELAQNLDGEISRIEERLQEVGGKLRLGWFAWTKEGVRSELAKANHEIQEIHARLADAKSDHKLSPAQIEKLRKHVEAATELHRHIYEMALHEGVFR
jgi:hypothetical protein